MILFSRSSHNDVTSRMPQLSSLLTCCGHLSTAYNRSQLTAPADAGALLVQCELPQSAQNQIRDSRLGLADRYSNHRDRSFIQGSRMR
jgi:hypothetical protein